MPLWLKLWINGTLGAPWSCMFCGSQGPSAFFAWVVSGTRKLHSCKRRTVDLYHSASPPRAKRFYVDCEFDGHGGALLSIALVRECGLGLHLRTTETATDPWVIENVMPLMSCHDADIGGTLPVNEVGQELRRFIGKCECPIIIADSPVDIGRFCSAISTGSDGGWASAEYPQMTFEVHNVDCYPSGCPDAVQHNAYWDAMALRYKLAEANNG